MPRKKKVSEKPKEAPKPEIKEAQEESHDSSIGAAARKNAKEIAEIESSSNGSKK